MVCLRLRGCDEGQNLLLSQHRVASAETVSLSHLPRNDQAKRGKLHLRCH
jgi:hypothetical protein